MTFDINEPMVLGTLVFETLGAPEREREFKIKSLKKWGFDLVSGTQGGKTVYGTRPEGAALGDRFEHEGESVSVTEVLKEYPKNAKAYARIEMQEGTAHLVLDLEAEESQEILRVPAGEILLAFLKKHRLPHLAGALRTLGSATELVRHDGESGKPMSFGELPPVPRRFLRDAKKIEKDMGFGRIALAWFGENKEGKPRYRMSWMVPTIALFDEHIAERIDKALAELK
jgi:uncharacterized protein (TIGR00703 family)